MASIVLVCVAAVSGTFLASRLREHLPDVDIRVSTLDGLTAAVEGADLIVVAPQLSAQRAQVDAVAAGRPVLALTPDDYRPGHAAEAAAVVRGTLDSVPPGRR